MLGMKIHFDISGSIEIRKVDIAGVACITFQLSILFSSWVKCDEKFNIWKLERKGTGKKQQPDSGIHATSIHCACVCQVSTL